MVKSECLTRVYSLRVMTDSTSCEVGTCFTMESDKNISKIMKQYIVTARHIFKKIDYPSSYNIEMFIGDAFQSYKANIYYHTNTYVDIAVLDIGDCNFDRFLGQQFSLKDMIWGQDVYILGFPNLVTGTLCAFQSGNQIPMIARACFSNSIKKHGIDYILLDGHNNPGFSGGPVCFYPNGNMSNGMAICGVVKGFLPNQTEVLLGKKNKGTNRYEATRNITCEHNEVPCNAYIEYNSGVFLATNIAHAQEIIETIP